MKSLACLTFLCAIAFGNKSITQPKVTKVIECKVLNIRGTIIEQRCDGKIWK